MKYAVDILIRVIVEADGPEEAIGKAFLEDWNDADFADVDTVPEDYIIKCDECGAFVPAQQYGYADTLEHFDNCSVDAAEKEERFRKAQAEWDRLHPPGLPGLEQGQSLPAGELLP
jgi:hypothetical protein